MKINSIPITERSNPKSINIDVLKETAIPKVLSDCEDEIFGGYNNFDGIYDKKLLNSYESFVSKIQMSLKNGIEVNVILLGSGTSGRLCRLMAKILNPLLDHKINLIPIIAGGIKALVRAEPNTEDKTETGISDYLSHTTNLDRSNCFVIGVTCGLSANYVKGALDEANKYSKGKTAIIGFNPFELATINLGKDIQVFNPIIGPEAIVGSVRMKGGTATMILIYALLVSSIKPPGHIKDDLIDIFNNCQKTLTTIRHYQPFITKLIRSGSQTLSAGGSIYLLGLSDYYGDLCIYDAAECPPTFGAKLQQVNGYSRQGISNLAYFPGEVNEILAKEIDFNLFIKNNLSHLTKNDMIVVFSDAGKNIREISRLSRLKLINFFPIIISSKGFTSKNNFISVENDWQGDFYKQLFVRSMLVNISTGTFILSGKVYKNKMIDLRITNKKLFLRSLRIINDITLKNETTIKKALLKNIYDGAPSLSNSLEEHIALSSTRENIVPQTILSLVYPETSVEKLKTMLINEPTIRKLIIKQMTNI